MKMKKVLALLLAVVLLVGCSVMGTLAYLSSQTQIAKNTFTVGDVVIWLDEDDVDESNTGTTGEDETGKGDGTGLINPGRDLQNDYQLIPGRVLDKDPTVWVKEGSEESYIRMLVTVSNIDALKNALPEFVNAADGVFLLQNLVDWNADVWQYAGYDAATATYEFRYTGTYKATADNKDGDVDYDKLPALFTKITVPGTIDNDNLALLNGVYIEVVAHAIQAEGFEEVNGGANAAWLAFDGQN